MFFAAQNAARHLKSFQLMNKDAKFERALMDYGSQIMTIIFQHALSIERYEDCAIIQRLFRKYHLDLNQIIEDYQAHFWSLGYSGRTAIAHLKYYLSEALSMLGYPPDEIEIPHYAPI